MSEYHFCAAEQGQRRAGRQRECPGCGGSPKAPLIASLKLARAAAHHHGERDMELLLSMLIAIAKERHPA